MTEKNKVPAKAPAAASGPSPFAGIGSILYRFFTADQHLIGLDIGSSYLKLLQLHQVKDGYQIKHYIARAIPPNIRDNAAEKRKFIGEFIKEFLSEARVKRCHGRLSLSGKGVFVFFLNVPNLNKKDLRGAVGIELKKRLPFQLDINNVSFDYYINGQAKDEKTVSLQVTCIAVDRFTIDDQVQFLKDIGIQPAAINAVSDVLGNLMACCFSAPADKTLALLDIGASTALLNFYKGKNLIFSREIPIGGDHLTHALAKAITTSAGPVTIGVEDAEKIKRNCGIPMAEDAHSEFLTDFGPLPAEQLLALLRPLLERLVLEISRTLTYYAKTYKTPAIEELYITGGTSRLKNLDKFLQFNLEGVKRVEHLNILKIVKGWADKGILKQELMMEQAAPHLAVAFGLCLGAAGKVNLIPPKERLEQKLALIVTLLRVAFPLILVISIGFYISTYANALKMKVAVSRVAGEINSMEGTASQVRQYMELKGKLDQGKGLLNQAKGRQPLWQGVLKELSALTPQEIVLTKVFVEQTKDGKDLHLIGRASSRYTIVDLVMTQYIDALEESPFFSDVRELSRKKDMYDPVPSADFELVCRMDY
ncbi:MAG TPA: type IV pilus assembly protein PilM [Candidatus Omnitrophota bacterium]|nr:type IV pilus assembly protein PilM [Candidatus Omnitrophota bacterium]